MRKVCWLAALALVSGTTLAAAKVRNTENKVVGAAHQPLGRDLHRSGRFHQLLERRRRTQPRHNGLLLEHRRHLPPRRHVQTKPRLVGRQNSSVPQSRDEPPASGPFSSNSSVAA